MRSTRDYCKLLPWQPCRWDRALLTDYSRGKLEDEPAMELEICASKREVRCSFPLAFAMDLECERFCTTRFCKKMEICERT